MSARQSNLFALSPPRTVVLLFRANGEARRPRPLVRWLNASLPALNWRSELFFVGRGAEAGEGALLELIQIVAEFLDEHELGAIHLRPLLRADSLAATRRTWAEIGQIVERFQRTAYREQSEARLLVSPIISASSVAMAREAAQLFASRYAEASFYAEGLPAEQLAADDEVGATRIYCEGPAVAAGSGIVSALWVNHVFESLLERAADREVEILGPCAAHVIVDEAEGTVHRCLWAWSEGRDAAQLLPAERISASFPSAPDAARCPRCIVRCLLAMQQDLRVNRRGREGSHTLHQVGLALLRGDEPQLAAELGSRAFEIAKSDADRAAALLQQALCCLDQRSFDEASELLDRAAKQGADRGLVAYQRGRVEVAQRDYIEALEHFAEVLRVGSAYCPVADLHFEMALCHLQIGEHAEALEHLEQCLQLGHESPPLRFNLGVCELALGRVEEALLHFESARRLGPDAEDLPRVLIYTATCFKELGRYDQAISVLIEAEAVNPQELAVQNLLGFCHYKMRRHQDAVACFERAVTIDPRSAIDWANLGSNLRELGRIEEAVGMYEKALSLDPTIDFARENLIRLRGGRVIT